MRCLPRCLPQREKALISRGVRVLAGPLCSEGMRELLEHVEAMDEPRAALGYLAAQRLELDDDDVSAAVRRALLVHAAGGDLRREPAPDDPAVRTLAADLDLAALPATLDQLSAQAAGLRRVEEALAALDARWLACALLADALAGHSDE